MAWKDRKEVASSLRSIYTAPTEEGLMTLAEFEDTWGRKYPHVVLSWKRHWPELATFFNYPEATPWIWKVIFQVDTNDGNVLHGLASYKDVSTVHHPHLV